MKSANIAELRNRLSHYLRLVRRGETVLVRDRDQVIARIEAVTSAGGGDEESRLADLVARGVLVRPKPRMTRAFLRDLAARAVQTPADVVAALLEEREEGR